jgi:hypothetical protein
LFDSGYSMDLAIVMNRRCKVDRMRLLGPVIEIRGLLADESLIARPPKTFLLRSRIAHAQVDGLGELHFDRSRTGDKFVVSARQTQSGLCL